MSDVSKIKIKISRVYQHKQLLVIALCNEYAAMAEKRFRQKQHSGTNVKGAFWTNRTSTASDTVFSGVIISQNIYGFFLAQSVSYGVYLELANDRKYESLRPTVMAFYSRFVKDLQELYE